MLPVDSVLPELLAALQQGRSAVLVAPPGAGKTTRVPLALLAALWAAEQKIIVLAPRRIAARAAAERMARERGELVGETIGYRVRLDAKVSRRTQIEVVTEGVFTRMILADPELSGVGAVVLDEFHERSLEGDLALALARDTQTALRPDLRLLVMSATLDASGVAQLLGDAPVIVSEGRMFPVTLHYRGRDAQAPLEQDMTRAVLAALREDDGDALVFLPGVREIERTATLLRDAIKDSLIDVRPLYGAMSSADQDAAIAASPGGRRKIVLATSIAETSLTIEGVHIVIDSGLTRRARFEPALGLTHLETVRASQAAIEQRRGRAGRTAPGACWRLWSEAETRSFPAFDRPDMLEADLSGLALDLASWGVTEPEMLRWLDPPPKPAWREAKAMLTRLGALDADGRLSEHGERVARMPLPPRLAHMVIAGAENGDALLAARAAVLLTEQGLGGRSVDLEDRLQRFGRDRDRRSEQARALADRIAGMASVGDGAINIARTGLVLARAFPDRVAKARGDGSFVMANGRAASVSVTDNMAREPFLVIADAAGAADRARILAAAPIGLSDVEALFAGDIEEKTEVSIDQNGARARRRRMFGRLVLSEAPTQNISPEEIEAALLERVRAEGLSLLAMDKAAQTRGRVALLKSAEPDAWPDWSDAALADDLASWLAPALSGVRRLADVDVGNALLARLPYTLRRRLDAEAPLNVETPAGGLAPIDYVDEGGPFMDVRLQEMFGVGVHPSIANGRIALTLRLLSPAGRPVQTTRDLPGFWRGSYAAVRSDMRGRYPKHSWPEDPLNAPPTRRAKPRS